MHMANLDVAAESEQAIAAQPEILSNYWHLGLIYLLADDLEAAQSVWLTGLMQLELNDAAPSELVNLLQAEAKGPLSEQPDRAELLCQQALELEPEQAELWFDLGQAVALQGRLEEAIEQWQQAIELRSDWAAPYRQQGEVWQRLEAYGQAAAYLKAREYLPFGLGEQWRCRERL
jgi:tetratricopeptide (TPR) repeat protein